VGDRSWPFYRDHRGLYRYRLKYLVATSTQTAVIILKRSNSKRYEA